MSVFAACADEPESATCDLDALIPGLAEVTAGPRDNVIAEVLALECGDGIAAPAALYTSLDRDLQAIFAVDARMRLEAHDAPFYPLHSDLAAPALLRAYGDTIEPARALLRDTCAHEVMVALGGTGREDARASGTPYIEVTFAARLSHRVLLALFASLGIHEIQAERLVGDGSNVRFRDTSAGREFMFHLNGGDCPSGCMWHRYALWRVVDGTATALGEWGANTENGFDPEPPGIDYRGFECRKCGDGRATRVAVEAACGDGLDDDCDDTIDCADPDCASTTACGTEVCNNGVDDNLDGDTDCADPECAASLACGAEVACEADADRTFIASYAARGLVVALDRNANGCGSDDVEACLLDTFALNGVSAQCGACLAAAGVCMAERCPINGFTDEQHDACVEAECGDAARACAP